MNELNQILKQVSNREEFWVEFLNKNNCERICEIGVYKGDFAKLLLEKCSNILNYFMVDPWRNLDDWNKPANTNNDVFERFYKETIEKTDFAANKRTVLRGKTTEVINRITDNSIDFAYIDGDHTLKGITIDIVSIWDKVKPNGFIAGDDFCPSIWQHSIEFEPTLVFPFAVYFAEAKNTKIYALPYNQFLISKKQDGFKLVNLAGNKYQNMNLKELINNTDKPKPEIKKKSFFKKRKT